MDVDIDVGRNQRGFWKAMRCLDALVITRRKTLNTRDAIFFYSYQGILYCSARTHESPRRYRADHCCPFVPRGERRIS